MLDVVSFIPRAVVQSIPLLYGSCGEILTEKSGNLNLGIPGVMYTGGICGVIGAFLYEQSVSSPDQMNAFLAIGIPLVCSLLGSLIMGLIYCFLTVTLRANQNVTGLAITTFGIGIGNFFGVLPESMEQSISTSSLPSSVRRVSAPLAMSLTHRSLFLVKATFVESGEGVSFTSCAYAFAHTRKKIAKRIRFIATKVVNIPQKMPTFED